jgi:hypothetical protein
MTYKTILKAAHKHSIFNKVEVLKSKLCGCFYCLAIFAPAEIKEWTDEENTKGMTALCPYCGIDAVVGENSGYPINNENFLKAMNERWFN